MILSVSTIFAQNLSMAIKNILKALGPGILFASTCIGVSHLVQSTRAGAVYGFDLIWIILLANLFKYPFFEYASRYANATGTSIIDGYNRLGKWVLLLYGLITIGTMFFVTSAVGVVTSGFMDNLLGISVYFKNKGFEHPEIITPILLFGICFGILVSGKYKVLDILIKVVGSILLISTLIAFTKSLIAGGIQPYEGFVPPDLSDLTTPEGIGHLGFIIALMGWMPTALDLSAWNSLWTVARMKQTGYRPKLKETLFDFNFGYIISALLAICFVTLGANLLYGSPEELSGSSAGFAAQVVEMFTSAMGDWSKWIIGIAAFCIMFGTAIAVMDGYARSSERILEILFLEGKKQNLDNRKREYVISILILSVVSFVLMYFLYFDPSLESKSGFKSIVDLATSTSFVVAPVIAILNFILVQKKYIGEGFTPPLWKKVISYFGILFLTGFSIFYFVN